MVEIDLSRKIGEGAYRTVYQLDDTRCAKLLRPKREKCYGGLRVMYPMWFYTLVKFGVSDYNKFEFGNYARLMNELPADTHKFFAPILGVKQTIHGSASICELVKDADDRVSERLQDVGMVSDRGFWEQVEFLRRRIVENNIQYFGVGHENLVVKKDGNTATPVFVDVKRIGVNMYPFQPWLGLTGMGARKINRAFDRLSMYASHPEPHPILL